ncbi:LexA family protein [Ileibacterium valens]|uniref:LexA family protein n=1 Tax=Ileibacterium valens TaxID=1862668 RepID=UPI00272D551E|nr:XRE family transcriptional regulator [Ileibacterium valens]
MNIAEVLTQFKRQNNVNNDYIADYCGVTKSTVSRWCTGKSKKVHPETLEKISQMLNIDLEDMTRVNGLAYEKPILGTVKAGYGLFAEENMEGYETVSEPDFHKGDYFLRVTGNSMKDANIHDGDLLFVKSCTDIPSGSIGVFLINHDEVTVKTLIKKPNCWVLMAANPDVEPKIFTHEEIVTTPVQIIGKAIYSKTEL